MSDFLPKLMQWDRRPDDFYATPGEGTQALLDFLIEKGHIKLGDRILEPACGEGHISLVLTLAGFNVTSQDLRQTGYGQGGVDFLDTPHSEDFNYDVVFTNPPFSLATSFIRTALAEAPVVCMLLKMDFWNADERYPLFDLYKPKYILPLTFRLAFAKEERGDNPFMNCMWCVWTNDEDEPDTIFLPLRRPKEFLNVDAASPIRGLLAALAENSDVRR